ncbi:MAG: chemotaxis protein CheD [Hydrogenophilus sp.]|nr:chemotaxis protein CheD [Hydrogenophilus sp.]
MEPQARFLHPGEWAVSVAHPLATLLGSCVAVSLWDPKLRIGGINHFLLPVGRSGSWVSEDLALAGDYAIEMLYNALLRQGANPKRLVAKVFGGGNVLATAGLDVGTRNVAFAQEWLTRQGIEVVASDVGGPFARRILFSPMSGAVYSRRIPVASADKRLRAFLAEEERRLRAPTRTGGEVELF